tara:strand:- start:28 stop:261 length:234 start_codon:yes stop_codon:yes gene_type:complete
MPLELIWAYQLLESVSRVKAISPVAAVKTPVADKLTAAARPVPTHDIDVAGFATRGVHTYVKSVVSVSPKVAAVIPA